MSADFAIGEWRKGGRSNSERACVEIAAKWRKSSHSNSEQDCVEVAHMLAAIGIRDSKNPQGGHLTLDRAAFSSLLDRAKVGDLDL